MACQTRVRHDATSSNEATIIDAQYPTVFRDCFGEETTIIYNNGHDLKMTLRGVTFLGQMFDDFRPATPLNEAILAQFTLSKWGGKVIELCGCTLKCDIPIPVVTPAGEISAQLNVVLELGLLKSNGGLDQEDLKLTLSFGDFSFSSSGHSGYFEDELLDIQRQLPPDVFMKSCINCAFSDYHVIGNGLYGGMLCFRDQRQAYRNVTTKSDFMKVMDQFTEQVQETYLCEEFDRRKPNTGYRG